jgi:hypothetical protein
MKTLYITIERDREAARQSQDGARFRARFAVAPGGPAFLLGRLKGSVTSAKAETEEIFGAIDWAEPPAGSPQEVRAVGILEFD